MSACALMLFPPPRPEGIPPATTVGRPSWLSLRDGAFWKLAVGVFCGTFAGLRVVGSLKPIGISGGLDLAVTAFGGSIFAVGNSAGRLWYCQKKYENG